MHLIRFAQAAATLACVLALACGAQAFSGSLSSPAGSGIDGTGFWITTGTTISWNVTPVTGGYNYWYKLVVPRADVSHFILETSENFTLNDMTDLSFAQGSYQTLSNPQLFGPSPANPFIPGNIYGIKFDSTTGTTLEFSFDSVRSPVWGDFYSKCGNVGGTQNTAWNTGFAAPDPTNAPSDGSINDHILVPDTQVVPEPASMMLAMLGFSGLLARGFRRR